jgi:hypothetical protein
VLRLLLLVPAVLAATFAAGCGDEAPAAPRPPVVLTLSAPRDATTTREATVQVVGRVTPATARVIVLGERVAVGGGGGGGGFSHAVALREGSNVIDVGASAPGRQAVWRALRVTRRSKIRMPDLGGREEDAARSALEGLGLKVHVVNDDDLLDVFRRGPRIVCSSDPQPGAQLDAGAEVEIVVSKTC